MLLSVPNDTSLNNTLTKSIEESCHFDNMRYIPKQKQSYTILIHFNVHIKIQYKCRPSLTAAI